ncbi:cyclase family protein [Actinoplanes sp. NBRC 103695]|uniref:cyclase family protein n=1 Tax=Actinoplanes sp. NBRC 103695 TaxID=3032202 RepID=UPI0024A01E3B|nr:cyclase family protein [Actinoplanes sp. NBRC 103695]GLY97629.1 cyclase [Actinoplanes sp. NBRC 103695]
MCTEKSSQLTRRAAVFGAAAAVTTAALGTDAASASARHTALLGRRLQDLTYPYTTSFPAFEPDEAPRRETFTSIEDDGYYMQEWRIIEHTGTHVDAPGHFIAGGRLSTELPLSELITPAVVVDIAARAAREPDTTVTVDDLQRYERRHGRIPDGAAVLMHSGWGAKTGDATAYRSHFPGFSVEACEWLLRKRRIRSLGVDTLSIDPAPSETFDTHLALLGADRYGLENLANLHRVPPSGATIVVGLMPYEQGSGGQARIFATW